ncbi:MAG: alpha/beta fold hydrolase [Pseudomonadota bacterium]|nr:alpha/beta fold hydrolase [Pseudomonadota bacterium]
MNYRNILGALLLTAAPAFASDGPYAPAISAKSVFTEVASGETLHAIESGKGNPVVFLHGLPSSAYLWRDVLPIVGKSAHAIAPDLPGYGYSDVPSNGGRDLTALGSVLDHYLDGLPDDKMVLVVNDVGSLLGLNYAVHKPERIAGIVLVEAVFQPPQDFMAQLRPDHLEFLQAVQDPAVVSSLTIDQPALVDMAIQSNTATELGEDILSNYRAPYMPGQKDHLAKREVLAATFGPDGGATFGMIAAENAAGLTELDVPILLIEADPGYMVNPPAIAYAKEHFKNLTISKVSGAMHFVSEDQPVALGDAINAWLSDIGF